MCWGAIVQHLQCNLTCQYEYYLDKYEAIILFLSFDQFKVYNIHIEVREESYLSCMFQGCLAHSAFLFFGQWSCFSALPYIDILNNIAYWEYNHVIVIEFLT